MELAIATHSREEVLVELGSVDVASVSTFGGEFVRSRMMHFVNTEFTFYLASMRGDPKTIQLVENPSVNLMIFVRRGEFGDWREVEVMGRALMVKDQGEREKALNLLAAKSPIVKQLVETGKENLLDCIRVEPRTVKYRVVAEVVRGIPPTVIEFEEATRKADELHILMRKLRHWRTEIRAPFLTATIVPVLLGTVIGWAHAGAFLFGLFLLALIGGISLHIAVNVLNDYFDHKSGTDDVNLEYVRPFSGGSRVIQLGLLSPSEVLTGGLFFLMLGAIIGLYLTFVRGLPILALAVIGVFSVIAYNAPPLKLMARGWGELLVGLNFGILMTLGAYYVQTQTFTLEPLVASLPVSFLIAAVLYVNEFPDYHADRKVGKYMLVVRLGRKKAVYGYIMLLALTYLSIAVGVWQGLLPVHSLASFVTLPFALYAIAHVKKYYDKPLEMVPANVSTILIHLMIGVILVVSYIIQTLTPEGLVYGLALTFIAGAYTAYQYLHIEGQKRASLALRGMVAKAR